jgi:hypothetical protein
MITIRPRNILLNPSGVIVHQVNCLGVMGSGIAKSIKQMYPPAFKQYEAMCDAVPDPRKFSLLGQVQFVNVSEHEGKALMIANMFSQLDTSSGSRETEYGAMYQGLKTIELKLRGLKIPLYIPYLIGCGFGGGDWNIVFEIIKTVFENSHTEVMICAFNPSAYEIANVQVLPIVKKRFTNEEFKVWLETPQQTLQDMCPIDLVHLGQIEQLKTLAKSKKS